MDSNRVICINDTVEPDKLAEIKGDFENWIVKDRIYTIREVLKNDGIVDGYLLEEVYNFPKFMRLLNRVQEPAFATWRFRVMKEDEVMRRVQERIETIKL